MVYGGSDIISSDSVQGGILFSFIISQKAIPDFVLSWDEQVIPGKKIIPWAVQSSTPRGHFFVWDK